jgi:hypothetical protein
MVAAAGIVVEVDAEAVWAHAVAAAGLRVGADCDDQYYRDNARNESKVRNFRSGVRVCIG